MMKEDFFDILGDVNIQHVKEAHMNKRGEKIAWAKWAGVAACFAMVVLCVTKTTRLLPIADDNDLPIETIQVETIQMANNEEKMIQDSSEESSKIHEDLSSNSELASRIEELSLSDSLGWIVYNNRVYIQDMNIDTIGLESNQKNIELSECVGKASDFTGAYSNSDSCGGDVFLVVNNSDIICIKLDNGATIWLGAE